MQTLVGFMDKTGQDIEGIQIFVMNMTLISFREVKKNIYIYFICGDGEATNEIYISIVLVPNSFRSN